MAFVKFDIYQKCQSRICTNWNRIYYLAFTPCGSKGPLRWLYTLSTDVAYVHFANCDRRFRLQKQETDELGACVMSG